MLRMALTNQVEDVDVQQDSGSVLRERWEGDGRWHV